VCTRAPCYHTTSWSACRRSKSPWGRKGDQEWHLLDDSYSNTLGIRRAIGYIKLINNNIQIRVLRTFWCSSWCGLPRYIPQNTESIVSLKDSCRNTNKSLFTIGPHRINSNIHQ
jgi:hypothetical protein